jgi:SAM-dependent methyltransferase
VLQPTADGRLRGQLTLVESDSIGQGCANFDRLAGIYRWMEWLSFGPYLQRCRCAWLDRLTGCRRALVLGDGDGRFTARLLRANPRVTVDAVDSSAVMLRALIRRAGADASRVNAHVADLSDWKLADAGYDLIVTHFLLDCLTGEEVRRLARAVRTMAGEDALWVVSEFAVPEGRFGRLVAAPLVSGLYWAFGRLTGLGVHRLPDYATALGEAGFALQRRRCWLGGLLVSERWRPDPEGSSGD